MPIPWADNIRSVWPGHRGRGLGSAEWLREANFHLCINQTGMWVQLIALGRHPTSKPFFFFTRLGPALCRGDEQLDGYCPGLSCVGRIHVSETQPDNSQSCLSCEWLLAQPAKHPPPLTLQLEKRWRDVSAAVDTFANLATSLNVSHHSLCWNNVSTFPSFWALYENIVS